MLWVVWLASVSWLWLEGTLGLRGALLMGALSLLVFAVPGHAGRRRRSELQYVEMGKAPVSLR
jgi:hypothetical protein